MLNFVYTPRFDGTAFIRRGGRFLLEDAVSARNPETGRFVGNKPDVHDPAWHHQDNFEPRRFTPIEEFPAEAGLYFENAQVREMRIYANEADDPIGFEDELIDHYWYEDEDPYMLAWEERDYWAETLDLWSPSLEQETEAWAQWQYAAQYPELWDDLPEDPAEDIGEFYEHLPHFRSTGSILAEPEGWWYDRHEARYQKRYHSGCRVHTSNGLSKEPKGWYSSDSHGRHGRKSGYTEWNPRDLRHRRHDIDGDTDYLWLVKITGDHENYGRMTAEIYLDAFAQWEEIETDRSLDKGYYSRLLKANRVNPNTFGADWVDEWDQPDFDLWLYYEELAEAERERYCTLDDAYILGEFDGFSRFRVPTMVYEEYTKFDIAEDNRLRALRARRGISYEEFDDFVDRYEFGVPTDEDLSYLNDPREDPFYDGIDYDDPCWDYPSQQDIEAMDAEERKLEELEEALEAAYERYPAGNGIGVRAQLSVNRL